MNNAPQKLFLLVFLAFTLPYVGFSQESSASELDFEVHKVYPAFAMSKAQLQDATTLVDLNRTYKPEWVKEYYSVEISAVQNGELKTVNGTDAQLNPEQKALMGLADVGSDISVTVNYLPNNNLKDNSAKEINFSFVVTPEVDAAYGGGQEALNQYLQENAINQIPGSLFTEYQLAAVKFSIDEAGNILDAEVVESSKNDETDALLLSTIANMPNWSPAAYENGTKVKQEFVLTVGNMESCVVNLLGIRQ